MFHLIHGCRQRKWQTSMSAWRPENKVEQCIVADPKVGDQRSGEICHVGQDRRSIQVDTHEGRHHLGRPSQLVVLDVTVPKLESALMLAPAEEEVGVQLLARGRQPHDCSVRLQDLRNWDETSLARRR